MRQMLKTLIVGTAGRLGHPVILKDARARFDRYMNKDASAIHPNFRASIFQMVMQNGGEKEFEQLVKLYEDSATKGSSPAAFRNLTVDIVDEKVTILGSLGQSKEPALIKRALQYFLSPKVGVQDVMYGFGGVAANPMGRVLLWEYIRDEKIWKTLYDRYYGGSFMLGRILDTAISNFATHERHEEISTFFKTQQKNGFVLKAVSRSIDQGLERVAIHSAYLKRDKERVAKFLSSWKGNGSK